MGSMQQVRYTGSSQAGPGTEAEGWPGNTHRRIPEQAGPHHWAQTLQTEEATRSPGRQLFEYKVHQLPFET